jgi:hypothetical protein
LIALRPECSAGNLVAAPGSATCDARLGGSGRQVEKLFLAGVAWMVDRGGGVLGLDVDAVQAETDGPIPPYFNLLVPSPALARLAKLRVSLRRLTPHLFGFAGDQPFVTLPVYCGVQSLSSEITTYTDTTPATGSVPFATFPCEQPPPVTTGGGGDGGGTGAPGGTGGTDGGGGAPLPAFGAQTLVTLKLAARRIPAAGPLKVLVSNANGFAITGALSGETVNRVTISRKRRITLKTRAFSLAAHATRTLKLTLSRTLRRLLTQKHKLTLRLTAKMQDPAGNTRTVKAKVAPRLKT